MKPVNLQDFLNELIVELQKGDTNADWASLYQQAQQLRRVSNPMTKSQIDQHFKARITGANATGLARGAFEGGVRLSEQLRGIYGDTCGSSINEIAANYGPGELVKVDCAMSLPTITIRVLPPKTENGEAEFEVVG